jgi:hypothetical protein
MGFLVAVAIALMVAGAFLRSRSERSMDRRMRENWEILKSHPLPYGFWRKNSSETSDAIGAACLSWGGFGMLLFIVVVVLL